MQTVLALEAASDPRTAGHGWVTSETYVAHGQELQGMSLA